MPFTIWVIPFTHGWLQTAARGVEEDRSDVVLDQFPFDLPYQQPPLLRVGLYRLPVDQRIDFLVAVSAIVARGAAGIVLIEILIRVVEPVLADHHPDGEVLAQHLRKPVGRVDHLELAVDIDLLQFSSALESAPSAARGSPPHLPPSSANTPPRRRRGSR